MDASEAEIAWAAGLFEGEGCFRITTTPTKSRCALMTIQMTDCDIVRRYARVVGARTVRGPLDRGPKRKPIYVADLAERPLVKDAILAFLPWLGVRRRARAYELLALIVELDRVAERRRCFCKRGHRRTPANTYTPPNGAEVCRTCKRDASRQWAQDNRKKYPMNTVLQAAICASGLTQGEVAMAAGIGQPTLSSIVHGASCGPERAGRIAAVLGVDPDDVRTYRQGVAR